MRVVITGATGNVGTALLRRLSGEPDVEVVGVVRRLPPPTPPYDRATWRSLNLADPGVRPELLETLRGADAVVHLAWQIQPTHDPVLLHRTNVNGSSAVIEAAVRAGVPTLVHASSVGAYAPGPKDRLVDEDWPTAGVPGSGYSRDKSTVERQLDAVESQLRVVRLRPALIFQWDAGCELARYFLGPLVPTGWLRRGRIPLVPDNPALRLQAVHADDVADAYVRALRGDVRGAFNLAAEPVLSPRGIAEALHGRTVPVPAAFLSAGVRVSWLLGLQPVDRGWIELALRVPLLSSARANTELGWTPKVDATTALRELIAGLAEHGSTQSPPLSARPSLPGRFGGLLRGHLPGSGNPY